MIIDERGRLFGRMNVIDLALLVIAAVMIPLAYGAYLLFRTPPTSLSSVTPSSIAVQKGADVRIRVTGEHLRPFLKAQLGPTPARAFLVESPERGEILFSNLDVGTYDVILYDEAEEVARLRNGLTVTPPPPPPPSPAVTLQVLGAFVGPAGSTGTLKSGLVFGPPERPVAYVLELGDVSQELRRMEIANTLLLAPVAGTERRAATLRVGCDTAVDICNVAGKPLANGVSLRLSGEHGAQVFVVDEIRSDSPFISDVTVRFLALPEVASLVQPGDVDRPAGAGPMRGAVIASVEGARSTTGTVNMNAGINASDVSIFVGSQLTQPLSSRDARLRVPVEATPNGWKYRGALIRPGGVVTFETPAYAIRGLILSMTPPVAIGARGRS